MTHVIQPGLYARFFCTREPAKSAVIDYIEYIEHYFAVDFLEVEDNRYRTFAIMSKKSRCFGRWATFDSYYSARLEPSKWEIVTVDDSYMFTKENRLL